MAKIASAPPILDYHVYDPNLSDVGGLKVVDRGGVRVVRMNSKQAQYFIDQGVIGLQRETQLSDVARSAHRQFRGQRA